MRSLSVTFAFATQIVQFIFFWNPTFQAFKYLFWLKSMICVGLPLSDKPKTGFIVTRSHIMLVLYHTKHPKTSLLYDRGPVNATLHFGTPPFLIIKLKLSWKHWKALRVVHFRSIIVWTPGLNLINLMFFSTLSPSTARYGINGVWGIYTW